MFGKYEKIYIICEINTIQTIIIQNALAHNSTFLLWQAAKLIT